jgi:hypothetical protein
MSLDEYRRELEHNQRVGGGVVSPAEYPEWYLPGPVVDLVLEFHNTGRKDVVFQLGGNNPGYVAVPRLEGPGAINLVSGCGPIEFSPPIIDPIEVKLAAGATHQVSVRELRGSPRARYPWRIHHAYWTRGGEYKLHFTIDTVVSPPPAGSKDAGSGFGRVKLTSNTVSLEVTAQQEQRGKTE